MTQGDVMEEEDRLNGLSMNILIHAGNAREHLINALAQLEEMHFDEARYFAKQARKEVITAHGLQTDTLQLEASGQQIRYSTLFCHAQDTLMTAQSELLIGEHLIKLFEKFSETLKK